MILTSNLFRAAAEGRSDLLIELLTGPVPTTDPLFTDLGSPLHIAAEYGQVESIRTLISCGFSVNSRRQDEQTPLHVACTKDNVAVVDMLVSNGAWVDALDHSGKTPLMCCAENGGLETVLYLISRGANIECRNTSGYGAMHLAVHHKHEEIALTLIKAGTDLTFGHSAVFCAAQNGLVPIVTAYASRGPQLINIRSEVRCMISEYGHALHLINVWACRTAGLVLCTWRR
jgi:ankyrin repeat protein